MRRRFIFQPDVKRLIARARSEGGFGLIELLIAMVVLAVAVMSLVAALSSSYLSVVRASRVATTSAIASAQMERYRAVTYDQIRLSEASVNGADGTYTGDTAYTAVAADRVTAASGCTEVAICVATQTVTGADGRSYRLDTYIVYVIPTAPTGAETARKVKKVTVVVRDGNLIRVRQTSTFDEVTGT